MVHYDSHMQVMDIRFASLFVDEGDTQLYDEFQHSFISRREMRR